MNALTVTQLNTYIKQYLDRDELLKNAVVQGEISNCKQHSTGHWYFSLKDDASTVRCIMFARQAASLRFRPENGMKVIVFGYVSAYTRDGAYQLYCTNMQPDGIGDLHVAYEQLLKKLGDEGLFDRSHKKPLPRFPRRIALITSGTGAAVRDMIRILGQRYPLSKVIVMSVKVQGEQAPAEIVGALRYANRYQVAELIITGRGGGSIEDLWAFNDERVARAIYDSEIPVISAVGHEPDVTISDYVADARASTPSNAAEIAVPDRNELLVWLDGTGGRIASLQKARTAELRKKLERLATSRALSDPMNMVRDRRMKLDVLQSRFNAGASTYLNEKRKKYVALAAAMDALSPLKVLSRGYSMIRTPAGHVVSRADQLSEGQTVDVTLNRGTAKMQVISAQENDW